MITAVNEINWNKIPKRFTYIAADYDGYIWAYTRVPVINEDSEAWHPPPRCGVKQLGSYPGRTCPEWKETLRVRAKVSLIAADHAE